MRDLNRIFHTHGHEGKLTNSWHCLYSWWCVNGTLGGIIITNVSVGSDTTHSQWSIQDVVCFSISAAVEARCSSLRRDAAEPCGSSVFSTNLQHLTAVREAQMISTGNLITADQELEYQSNVSYQLWSNLRPPLSESVYWQFNKSSRINDMFVIAFQSDLWERFLISRPSQQNNTVCHCLPKPLKMTATIKDLYLLYRLPQLLVSQIYRHRNDFV